MIRRAWRWLWCPEGRLGTILGGGYLAIIVGLVVLCTGCAGPKVPPAVQVERVEVKVAVPVSCVKRATIPAEPPHVASTLTGEAAHDLLIVDGSALDLRTWGESLAAMLSACAAD